MEQERENIAEAVAAADPARYSANPVTLFSVTSFPVTLFPVISFPVMLFFVTPSPSLLPVTSFLRGPPADPSRSRTSLGASELESVYYTYSLD